MLFQNSYSANRGKRDIVEEEEIEDEELTDDEYDELMGRYFNPNGFFFQPGKRSNPNSKSKGPYLKYTYLFMFLAFLDPRDKEYKLSTNCAITYRGVLDKVGKVKSLGN